MGFLLLLLIVTLSEIYILIKFAAVVGALKTIIIIITAAAAGVVLARMEIYGVFGKIKKQFDENKDMTDSAMELVFILFGAFLMVVPGFITDVIGLLMILPFTRMYFVTRVSPGFRKKIQDIVEQKKKEFNEKRKKQGGGA